MDMVISRIIKIFMDICIQESSITLNSLKDILVSREK